MAGPSLASRLRHAVDPAAFAAARLGFAPDPWQARVLRSPSRQVLLNCARQSGKSTTTAILALHRAVHAPGSLVLVISPSQRQSRELFLKVCDYRRALDQGGEGPGLAEDNRLSLRLDNGSRVVALPSSEATIRGFSAVDLVVEDEAARVRDETYLAVRPMVAVSGGRVVLMSTPFGRRGHFYDAWARGGDAWARVEIAADRCPRISAEFLAEERAALGEWRFRQEYLCEFVEGDDQLFAHDAIARAVSEEVRPLFAPAREPVRA